MFKFIFARAAAENSHTQTNGESKASQFRDNHNERIKGAVVEIDDAIFFESNDCGCKDQCHEPVKDEAMHPRRIIRAGLRVAHPARAQNFGLPQGAFQHAHKTLHRAIEGSLGFADFPNLNPTPHAPRHNRECYGQPNVRGLLEYSGQLTRGRPINFAGHLNCITHSCKLLIGRASSNVAHILAHLPSKV
jgi:hypothetical protein